MSGTTIGCETCNNRNNCDAIMQFECYRGDSKHYCADSSAFKPKYNSLIINSLNEHPSAIEEELNKYFAENPTDTIFSVKEIMTRRGESLLIIFEKH